MSYGSAKMSSGPSESSGGSSSGYWPDYTELSIVYDWDATGQSDLDTATYAFDGAAGYGCGEDGNSAYGNQYLQWTNPDNYIGQGLNGFERIEVYTDKALEDGLWDIQYSILCYAGWYSGRQGVGPAYLRVTYKGGQSQKINKVIWPGSQGGCATTLVAIVTVYTYQQADGRYFSVDIPAQPSGS